MNKIRIYIHHGGRFNEDNLVVKYENETVSVIPEINDVDEVDLFYIRDYYTKLGYDRLPTLYWKMPVFQNLKLALQPLECDKDILEMVEWAKKDGGDAHVYYEHVPSIPELVELLPASQEDIPINHEEPPPLSQEDTTQPLNQDIPPPNHDIPPPQTKTAVEIALEELEILLAEDAEDTCFLEPNVVSGGQPNVVSDSQPNVGSEGQPKMGNEGQHETGNKGQGDMGNEGQPEMGNEEPSHMGNEGQGDMGNEEPSLPKNKRRKQENRKGNIKNIVIEEGSDDEVLGHTKNYNCNEHPDKDSDSWCSEYLKTPNSSDDEETDSKTVYPQFNEGSAYGSVELELTMEFATLESFKQALRDFTIKLGRDIVWIKNDKKRVRACCKSDGCPWEIYCAWSKVTNSYQIKTYQEEHTCCRVFENKQATQQWIAGKLVNKLRKNPSMQHGKIVAHMKEKYGVAIEPSKVYRAVQDAKKLIEGGEHEQYSKLWDYCHELLKSNPGSTVKMDTIPKHNGEVQFDRLYICLAGCKNGFKAGCRPLIGLDGCFLKGYYGGQLLTAVGQDGNNQVWVIAYAVVSVENKDNWKWFLTLLHQDLGDFRQHGWNFISDMQKGLIPALQEVMPGAHHRFCVWHLWHNFSKQWKEKELRVLLWQCARSTTPTEFNENMERLKRKNEKAWEYLSNKPKEAWTKAWFSEWPKVDNITNNICEVFNAMILVARSKPIVNMLEDIQSMIMTNIATNKLKLSGHTFLLPPVQKSRLEYEKEESNKWTPKWSGDDGGNIFEVQLGQTTKKCSVNLCTHTCSCRFWQLTGMPCKHAVAAIAWKKAKPEDYCHAWLTMGAYNEIYNHHVNPVPGRQFWEKTEYNNVVPPLHRKTGGRPKRMRRKDGKGKREETVKGA